MFILVFWTNSKAMAQMFIRWPRPHVVGLSPRPVCMIFVVEKVSLKQIIFHVLWISSAKTIRPISTHIFHSSTILAT